MLKGASLCMALLLAVISTPLPAQEDAPETVYAELMPLASRSLLLDVTVTDTGRLVAVGERGHVVWSDDGEQWTQAEEVPTRSTLTSITHRDGQLWAAGHDTVIVSSTDGGRTWSLQSFDPDRQQPIMDIYFLDAEQGFAIGAYGLMLITYDGGETWEDGYVSDEEWHLNALVDLGDGSLVIAGEAGLSYVSEDSGETWEVIDMPYQGSMFGVIAAGECTLVFGLRGNVQESCDGGFTWDEMPTGTQSSLSGGASRDGTTLLAGNSGALLVRQGDGPFQARSHSSGVDFAAVAALEDGRFLLVGEDGVHWYPGPEAR